MKKIDWIRKLTSRKFWLSVASFVSMLIVALGGAEATATQVTGLIMAGATVIGYVIGEGLADAGVAGLMGNLYAESGLNPQNLQNTYEKRLGFTDASYTAAVDSAPTPTSSETGLATASHSGHTGAARRPCSTTRRRPARPSAT